MVTVVLLAGGKSSRMGTDKLMLPQRDGTVLEQAVRRFSAVFDRVLVSVASPDCYPDIPAERIADEFPGCGPMAGIQAGLKHCRPEGAFFLPGVWTSPAGYGIKGSDKIQKRGRLWAYRFWKLKGFFP